jgi:CO/xanthine dehydrogenase Mo-binding subunit
MPGILNIDTSRAKRLSGGKVLLLAKIRLGKSTSIPHSRDQYLLAVDKVRYIGEEVAAVAAVDEETALEALDLIQVEYELLAPIFDPLRHWERWCPCHTRACRTYQECRGSR